MSELARAALDDLGESRAGRESTGFTRTCPACGRVGERPLGVVNALPVGLCRGCRTVFVSSIPAVDDAQYYDAYYHEGNLEVPPFIHDRLEELAVSLERYRLTGRWLDVGFGAGALMRAAATRGWRVTGTEVSHGAVDAARAQEFDVMHGELGELRLGAGSFDVVSMVEVLEHVPDPAALLSDAARLLRPGGALYLTTPHSRGVSALLLGKRWSAMSPPEHLQLFSVAGLRVALARASLDERSIRTHAVNPHELLRGGFGRRVGGGGGERVQTGYGLNESLSSGPLRRAVKRLVNEALNASRLGDSLKALAEKPPMQSRSRAHT
jgi:SAM-dependent methyltransferase